MYSAYTVKWKPFVVSVLISMGVGGLSGFLTKESMDVYQVMQRPALSPPSSVFPVVWTILFFLMGVSAFLISISDASSAQKKQALTLWVLQLAVNFFWPFLFFSFQKYFLAFFWLILLWILIAAMIYSFYRISKLAAWLQVPYFLWVTFAGYLNFMIAILNR